MEQVTKDKIFFALAGAATAFLVTGLYYSTRPPKEKVTVVHDVELVEKLVYKYRDVATTSHSVTTKPDGTTTTVDTSTVDSSGEGSIDSSLSSHSSTTVEKVDRTKPFTAGISARFTSLSGTPEFGLGLAIDILGIGELHSDLFLSGVVVGAGIRF